jgi:hypothetical protein
MTDLIVARTSGDHDIHKGAVEDARLWDQPNAPGLDEDGLPNDENGHRSR